MPEFDSQFNDQQNLSEENPYAPPEHAALEERQAEQLSRISNIPESIRGVGPLGIRHLLLLMLGASLALAMTMPFLGWSSDFIKALKIIECIPFGVAIASLFILAGRKYVKLPILTQPGHWVLMLTGIFAIITFIKTFYFHINAHLHPWENLYWYIAQAAIITSWLLPAFCLRMEIGWRIVFILQAMHHITAHIEAATRWAGVTDYFWYNLYAWSDSISFVSILLLVGIAFHEHSHGPRRDWLHWTGLVCLLIVSAILAVWFVVFWILPLLGIRTFFMV